MSLKPKVAIIGAGNVGIRYAYCLMLSGAARSLVIVDLDRNKAEGEVMDLASGMPYISPIEIFAGDYPDMKDSDLVVITAGARQKPGQSRMDLVGANIAIFKAIVPKVVQYAPQARILVVTNPVDVLSYAAYKISGKPWQEVIGSGTVLDSARFRFLLSRHCQVDARNIHAYILGEHGDTEFPVLSSALIGGAKLDRHCPTCRKCSPISSMRGIFDEVRDFAYKVIEKKGETSYGIGLALTRITEAILNDENYILPVSCFVQDYYGVQDVYMSLPAVVNKGGVREILDIRLSPQEEDDFRKSAAAIKSVIKGSGL